MRCSYNSVFGHGCLAKDSVFFHTQDKPGTPRVSQLEEDLDVSTFKVKLAKIKVK